MGERVARRDATNPRSNQSGTLASTASAYPSESEKGAPATSKPGAAVTPPTRPIIPLVRPSPICSASQATAPMTTMGTSPKTGPRRRIRLRYQRGPSYNGARDRSPVRRALWSWRVIVSIRTAYVGSFRDVGLPLSDHTVAALAVGVAVAAWSASVITGLVVGAMLAVVVGSFDLVPRRAAVILILVGGSAGWRGDVAWSQLFPDRVGTYEGWIRMVDDPAPYPGSIRVIAEVEGQRYEMWVRGRAMQMRASEWRGGDRLRVLGELRELSPERRTRVSWQHVVGELRLGWVSDVTFGTPVDRASNRVRATIERAGSVLPGDDGALYRGLVVGDDRDQPREMIDRFRASGLSHLTAVSGQNVAFVLAAAGPLLRRLRAGWRWAATVALIAWFVSLTRFEPSIVRAGTMAALSATAFVLGRERAPARLLCLAVVILVMVDPLLVGSIGFWLSVGATGGVAVVGPRLASRFSRLGPLAMPLGITLGAQIGVVGPALLVFGQLPLVSVPANLLAVPVAGAVMLYGLPAGLVAGLVPQIAPVVMFPCRVGVRWVDTIAIVAARSEPGGVATVVGWAVLLAVLAWVVFWPSRLPPPH
jgi:competence protein ComEC